MALEHDVEALITRVRTLTERVRHLEEMLTGPTIKLEAGGSSIVISPQGIVLDSSQNLMIHSAGSLTLRGQKRVLIDTQMEYEVAARDLEVTASGRSSTSIGGNASITVGGTLTERIGSSVETTVGKYVVLSAGMDFRLSTGRTAKIQVGQDLEVQARKHIAVGAGEEISIKTGSASITTKKDGDVAIKGKDVNIEAAGKMTAKAAGEMVVKGSKISQN